jgi:hypothetical protein
MSDFFRDLDDLRDNVLAISLHPTSASDQFLCGYFRGVADYKFNVLERLDALLAKHTPEKPKDTLLPPSSQSTGDE